MIKLHDMFYKVNKFGGVIRIKIRNYSMSMSIEIEIFKP